MSAGSATSPSLRASDLSLRLGRFFCGRGWCVDQVVGDEELHGRVHLRLQVSVLLNRHVQLDRVQVNDHASDLGRVLLTDHLMHVLVDGSADNLLAGIGRRLSELLRVKHAVDLLLVHLRLLEGSLLLLLLLRLLALHLHRHRLSHLLVLVLVHLVVASLVANLLRLSRCLRLSLVAHLLVVVDTLVGYLAVLLMAVTIATAVPLAGVLAVLDLVADDPIKRLLAHVAVTLLPSHGYRVHPARLIAALQLIHQEAQRGDQLDQIRILGPHDVHLVLLVGLLVHLLFEVKTSGLSWLRKGHVEMPALEEDLGGGLLGSSS